MPRSTVWAMPPMVLARPKVRRNRQRSGGSLFRRKSIFFRRFCHRAYPAWRVVRVPMAEWRSFRATCGGEGRQEAIRGIVSAPNQACLSLAAKSALSQPLPAPGVRLRA